MTDRFLFCCLALACSLVLFKVPAQCGEPVPFLAPLAQEVSQLTVGEQGSIGKKGFPSGLKINPELKKSHVASGRTSGPAGVEATKKKKMDLTKTPDKNSNESLPFSPARENKKYLTGQKAVGAQGGLRRIDLGKRDPLEPVERPVEEEVILTIRFGRYTLSDGMIAYLHRGGLLLPLGLVADSMDFLIEVDLGAGQAKGFFISEERTFSLDLLQGNAIVEGKVIPFEGSLVELHEDDIYVDSTLFAKWFPVNLDFKVSNQEITLTAEEKLPLEARLERERKNSKLLGRVKQKEEDFPLKKSPYKLFDVPFIDNNLTSGFDSRDETFSASYNSVLSGDLLFLGSTLRLAGDRQDNLSDARLTMGRQDIYGKLLGPLEATEFSLGDVFSTQIPLVASNQEGVGFKVSNFPLLQQSEFDRINLRGELAEGWQAELYRNEVLLNSQFANDEGRYEFLDVPLIFGVNIIRIIFYGPQGQIRERVQTFNIGENQARPGQQYFRASANLARKDLIPLTNENDGAGNEIDGEARILLEYERGINRYVSFVANGASLPFESRDGGRKYFGTLGLRTGLLGALSRINLTFDDQSGRAIQVATQGRLAGVNVFVEHGQFFDFTSERVLFVSDSIISRSILRLDGQIPSPLNRLRLPFTVNANVERSESGRAQFRLSNRLSAFFKGVSVSNNANFTLSRFGPGTETTSGNGSLQISGRYDKLAVRGNFSYGLIPEMEAQSLSATVDYNFTRDFSARLLANQQLSGNMNTDFGGGINLRFENFAIGFDGTYNDQGDFTAGLSISFSFARDPRSGGIEFDSNRLASVGAASTRVFLDNNTNGKFDDGDRPLKDIEFRGGGRKGTKTDEGGMAFLLGLPQFRPTNIKIKEKSLEDPLWLVKPGGYKVITRPGRPALLDFPVTPTGEVDGTVYIKRNGKTKEVSKAKVQLVDGQGKVIGEESTAFDGFYLFTSIPVGKYKLRISPEQINRLQLKNPDEQEVDLTGEEPFLSGMDFVVEPRDAIE